MKNASHTPLQKENKSSITPFSLWNNIEASGLLSSSHLCINNYSGESNAFFWADQELEFYPKMLPRQRNWLSLLPLLVSFQLNLLPIPFWLPTILILERNIHFIKLSIIKLPFKKMGAPTTPFTNLLPCFATHPSLLEEKEHKFEKASSNVWSLYRKFF